LRVFHHGHNDHVPVMFSHAAPKSKSRSFASSQSNTRRSVALVAAASRQFVGRKIPATGPAGPVYRRLPLSQGALDHRSRWRPAWLATGKRRRAHGLARRRRIQSAPFLEQRNIQPHRRCHGRHRRSHTLVNPTRLFFCEADEVSVISCHFKDAPGRLLILSEKYQQVIRSRHLFFSP
jgi:hypothetical protein